MLAAHCARSSITNDGEVPITIDQSIGKFAQVHRSVVVNLRAVSHVRRHDNETAEIHLKGRKEVLPVSRNYLHLFRQT